MNQEEDIEAVPIPPKERGFQMMNVHQGKSLEFEFVQISNMCLLVQQVKGWEIISNITAPKKSWRKSSLNMVKLKM